MTDFATFSVEEGKRIARATSIVEKSSPGRKFPGGSPGVDYDPNKIIISAVNETAGTFNAGDHVEIDGVYINTTVDEQAFRYSPTVKIKEPGSYSDESAGSIVTDRVASIYGVTLDYFGAGSTTPTFGRVALAGVYPSLVIGIAEARKFAIPISSTYVRQTDQGHHRLIYVEPNVSPEDNIRWCLVMLNSSIAGDATCPYFWEFEVSGGSPSSGSQIWDITLNSDQQDVTVDADMTAAELKAEFLSEFSGMTTDDIEVTPDVGGLPEQPLTVQFKNAFAEYASAAWNDGDVVVGTNSLNNDGWMKVRQINPRA